MDHVCKMYSIVLLNQVVHTVSTTLYRVNILSDYLLKLRFSGKRRHVGWRNQLPLFSILKREVKKVKQSRYRPGVAQRVPGS